MRISESCAKCLYDRPKEKEWEAVHSKEFKRFYRAVGNSYEYAYTEFYPESFDKIY